MNPNFLEIKNATFVASEKNKINNVSLTIKEKGEIVCLLGPSGVGKTTILRTIAAVGRQHIRYFFVANHKTNLADSFTGNAVNGTEALRATLTSQISSLTNFPIASIRLQAMLALLWLTPAPSEYHNTSSR